MSRMFVAALAAGLFGLLISAAGAPARAFVACETPNYYTLFGDPRLVDGPCDLVGSAEIHWSGNVRRVRAIKQRGVPMDDSAEFRNRITEIARRVGSAMEIMGGLDIDDVTILFTNYASPADPDARPEPIDKGEYDAVASSPFAHECPVAIYKSELGMDEDAFLFTIVHELFHCIQYKVWDRVADADWWSEGSAEYFAQLAVPGVASGDGYFSQFDSEIFEKPLNEMSYEAVTFWAWLGAASGPPAVGRLISGLGADLESSITPDMWGDFAKAYYDRAIILPGGRALPSTPAIGPEVRVAGAATLHLDELPLYTLTNERFIFESGKYYTLAFRDQPSDLRMFWKEGTAGAGWTAPPEEVSTCDGEQSYKAMWGMTHSRAPGTIDIHGEDLGSGAAATCSLLGTWVMSAADLSANIAVLNPKDSCALESGALRIIFTPFRAPLGPQGPFRGAYNFDDIRFRCDHPPSQGGYFIRTVSGSANVYWRSVSRSLILAFPEVGRSIGTIRTESHSRASTTTKTEDFVWGAIGIGPTLGGRYTLTGDRFFVATPAGYPEDPNYQFDFFREGASPR